MMKPAMRPSDREALASLEKKLHLVRDHVTAVARGYKTGYYLYGTGGLASPTPSGAPGTVRHTLPTG